MVHAGRLKSAKEAHIPDCKDVAPLRFVKFKETSVRQARAVATFCPFANEKGRSLSPRRREGRETYPRYYAVKR